MLDDRQLLRQDSRQLLNQMGPVRGRLQLDDDGLHNLVINPFQLDVY